LISQEIVFYQLRIPIDPLLFWLLYYSSLSHISYFILGIVLSKKQISFKKKHIILIFIIFLTILLINFEIKEYSFIISPIDTLLILSLIPLLFEFSKFIGKYRTNFFNIAASLSYGVYLIHELVLRQISDILSFFNITLQDFIYFIFLFLLVPLISFCFIRIIAINPYHHIIIGKEVQRNRWKVINFQKDKNRFILVNNGRDLNK
jgi:peptidoglycan/LPS O-acetylase OafA/YrhL